MSFLCTGFAVRAKAARVEAARRHGTYITCRAGACRADEKTARENPSYQSHQLQTDLDTYM